MRNLFKNLFKQKNKEVNENSIKPFTHYTIKGKDWVVDESMSFKVQSSSENIRVYGYTLETRFLFKETWSQWHTYYTNKIYHSATCATLAGIQASKLLTDYEWRVMPLYTMDQQQFRDFKLNKLFSEDNERKLFPIKGWKVKDDIDYENGHGKTFKYKKNTLFIQLENGTIVYLSNKTDKTQYDYRKHLNYLLESKSVDEVDIKEEKWAYPHLLKELKLKLK